MYEDRQPVHTIHASTNLLASMLVYTSECPTAYRLEIKWCGPEEKWLKCQGEKQ